MSAHAIASVQDTPSTALAKTTASEPSRGPFYAMVTSFAAIGTGFVNGIFKWLAIFVALAIGYYLAYTFEVWVKIQGQLAAIQVERHQMAKIQFVHDNPDAFKPDGSKYPVVPFAPGESGTKP